MKWFKRKKVEIERPPEFNLIVEYIKESRECRKEDLEIFEILINKRFDKKVIEEAFKEADKNLPLKKVERRDNMVKEEYDEEEDFDDEEVEEEDEDEEEEEKPKKPVKVKKEVKKVKEVEEEDKEEKPKALTNEELTSLIQQMIQGVREIESRLSNCEAAFFRIKNI